MFRGIAQEYGGHFYFVFRVLIGLLLLLHGVQKLFGVFGGQTAPMFTFFWVAGLIELVVGTLITVGLLTRIAALLGALEMVYAYTTVHLPQGFVPLLNQGEPAVLFFAAFLVLMAHGYRKWGMDNF